MKTRLLVASLVLAVILVIGTSIYATGKTYYVPKDFATLQEALNAAKDGDTIVLAEGTYEGNIYFKGKSITLKSTNPDDPDVVANTIIEGTDKGSAITIDSNATINGLTITISNPDCRGIDIKNANPTIENCTIIDNSTATDGGIYISNKKSKPQIINCVITGNISGGTPQISQSIIGEELVNNPQENESEQIESAVASTEETQIASPLASSPIPVEDKMSANVLFVGIDSPAAVYKYVCGDNPWEKISPTDSGLGLDGEIVSLCEHNGTIYAATNGYITDNAGWEIWIGKVWKYNGDTNWEYISERFDQGPWENFEITAMAVFKDTLYVAIGRELFKYVGGTTWQKIPDPEHNIGDEITALGVWNNNLYIGNEKFDRDCFLRWSYCDGETIRECSGSGGTKSEEWHRIFDFTVWNNKLYSSTHLCIYDYVVEPYGAFWHSATCGFDFPPPLPMDKMDKAKVLLETFNGSLYYSVGRQLIRGGGKVLDTSYLCDDPELPYCPADYGLIISMASSPIALVLGTTGKDEIDFYYPIPASPGQIYAIHNEIDGPKLLPTIPVNDRKDIQTLLLLGRPLEKTVWYVDDDAPSSGNGTTWNTAFKYLQDALNNPLLCAGDEIWVGQGTYKPDQGNGIIDNNPNTTFQLINCVSIKGGYAGFGASNPNERNIATYQTILSGDLLGNDLHDFPNLSNTEDNSYHVINGSGVDSSTVLDGFTIQGGHASGGYSDDFGGGLTNINSGWEAHGNPTVTNCIFSYNWAQHGGAVCHYGTYPYITPEPEIPTPVIPANSIYIDSCQILDQANTTYYLTRNLSGSDIVKFPVTVSSINSACFPITADNITLNFNGHKIECDSADYLAGVYAEGVNNINVINGIISINGHQTEGIRFNNVSGGFISSNTIRRGAYPINLTGSNNIKIVSNNIDTWDSIEGFYPAVYLVDSTENLILWNRISSKRHGLYLQNRGTGHNTIDNNDIYGCGAHGIYVRSSNNEIKNNRIHSNHLKGIQLFEADNNVIENNDISNNNAGGIKLTLATNNVIRGNYISSNGEDGIYVTSTSFSNQFINNNVTNNEGSGFNIDYSQATDNILQDNVFCSNVTMDINSSGGAVITCTNNVCSSCNYGGCCQMSCAKYSGDSSPKFENCVFYNNYAEQDGGGASINSSSSAEFINCVFVNNSVGEVGNGGGITFEGNNSAPLPKLINCTFYGNSAPVNRGGSICNYSSSPIIINSILWNNGYEEIYNMPGWGYFPESNPTVTYCDIEGGYLGEGNINSDPLFIDELNPAGEDDTFLTWDDGLGLRTINGPCIDTANDAVAPETDIFGLEHVDAPGVGFSIADMGAYEYRCNIPLMLLTIHCDGTHSRVGPLRAGEYKVMAFNGAISHINGNPNSWTWNGGEEDPDYIEINGIRWPNEGPYFNTQTEAFNHWAGTYITLQIPEDGYIDGYFYDRYYPDNLASCTVAIYIEAEQCK